MQISRVRIVPLQRAGQRRTNSFSCLSSHNFVLKCWGAWKGYTTSRPPSREEMNRTVTQHLFWSQDKYSWNLLFRAFFLACYPGPATQATFLHDGEPAGSAPVKVLKSRGSPVRALLILCKQALRTPLRKFYDTVSWAQNQQAIAIS